MLVALLVLDHQDITESKRLFNHRLVLACCLYSAITPLKGDHQVVSGVAVEVTFDTVGRFDTPEIIVTVRDDIRRCIVHLEEPVVSLPASGVDKILIRALPVRELLKFQIARCSSPRLEDEFELADIWVRKQLTVRGKRRCNGKIFLSIHRELILRKYVFRVRIEDCIARPLPEHNELTHCVGEHDQSQAYSDRRTCDGLKLDVPIG